MWCHRRSLLVPCRTSCRGERRRASNSRQPRSGTSIPQKCTSGCAIRAGRIRPRRTRSWRACPARRRTRRFASARRASELDRQRGARAKRGASLVRRWLREGGARVSAALGAKCALRRRDRKRTTARDLLVPPRRLACVLVSHVVLSGRLVSLCGPHEGARGSNSRAQRFP
jgi:hypothetical protein